MLKIIVEVLWLPVMVGSILGGLFYFCVSCLMAGVQL